MFCCAHFKSSAININKGCITLDKEKVLLTAKEPVSCLNRDFVKSRLFYLVSCLKAASLASTNKKFTFTIKWYQISLGVSGSCRSHLTLRKKNRKTVKMRVFGVAVME